VGPVSPGALALRIAAAVESNDGPDVNDLILEVDRRPVQLSDWVTVERGGAEAKVLQKGEIGSLTLPSGLSVRPTAAPLTLGTDSLIGNAPIVDLELEAGDYLLMLRADGHADQRVALYISRGADRNVHVALEPQHSTPPGFVRVVNYRYGIEEHDFYIMEREVTVREYFEFLHDPQTLAEIKASPQVIRIPRSTIEGLHAPRGPDGRFTLGDELQWDWPIFGISWHDANAYAMWKTRQARLAGRNETYALPTLDQWAAAAGLCYGCKHVFGNRFRHKWVCSVYSKPKADPQPVMSYPIDESCFGVYDMSGSVSEWLNSFWREEKGTYRHAGGSWAHGGSGMFQAYGGNGLPPDNYSDTVGFRLVMRRDVHDD
jgi:serine/threonine-protein kinase